MDFKSIEKIKIDRTAFIEWFYNDSKDEYGVCVKKYNRTIYNKVLDKKHYNIYHNFINERVKFLIKGEVFSHEYCMILLDNTLYNVLDKFHFMELHRFLVPVDSLEEYRTEDNLFDIVLDATVRTGEIFDETDLLFHHGRFYNNQKQICSIYDFTRDGIEFEYYDLLNGLNGEQLNYILDRIYYSDSCNYIVNYVTKDVKLKIIDR